MEYLIGAVLALSVAGFAMGVGLDRDRSFGATILIVTASYYMLFAVMGGSTRTLVLESLVATGFLLLSAIGFRMNMWLIALAMVGHGVFDLVQGSVIPNPGVPPWWPGFCMAFDVFFGGWLAAILMRRPELSPPQKKECASS